MQLCSKFDGSEIYYIQGGKKAKLKYGISKDSMQSFKNDTPGHWPVGEQLDERCFQWFA